MIKNKLKKQIIKNLWGSALENKLYFGYFNLIILLNIYLWMCLCNDFMHINTKNIYVFSSMIIC